jgi:hypothetical protein
VPALLQLVPVGEGSGPTPAELTEALTDALTTLGDCGVIVVGPALAEVSLDSRPAGPLGGAAE